MKITVFVSFFISLSNEPKANNWNIEEKRNEIERLVAWTPSDQILYNIKSASCRNPWIWCRFFLHAFMWKMKIKIARCTNRTTAGQRSSAEANELWIAFATFTHTYYVTYQKQKLVGFPVWPESTINLRRYTTLFPKHWLHLIVKTKQNIDRSIERASDQAIAHTHTLRLYPANFTIFSSILLHSRAHINFETKNEKSNRISCVISVVLVASFDHISS